MYISIPFLLILVFFFALDGDQQIDVARFAGSLLLLAGIAAAIFFASLPG